MKSLAAQLTAKPNIKSCVPEMPRISAATLLFSRLAESPNDPYALRDGKCCQDGHALSVHLRWHS